MLKFPCLFAASAVACDPPWRLSAHHHAAIHEMLIIEVGRHESILGGRAYVSEPGMVLLAHPGVEHVEWAEVPTAWLVVSFEWPGAPALPVSGRDSQGRIRALARWILTERDSLSSGRDALRNYFLRALLAEYADNAVPRADALVERIRSAVRERLDHPWALRDLARLAGYSRFAFVREYARRSGLTPMADVRRLRLEKARELLTTSDAQVKAIAARTGLGDAHALSRQFRRHFGHTPGALRRTSTSSRPPAAPRILPLQARRRTSKSIAPPPGGASKSVCALLESR